MIFALIPSPFFVSEGLPRFEGIETKRVFPSIWVSLWSEGLPRFEGIETLIDGSREIFRFWSEGLPRFEGIETRRLG